MTSGVVACLQTELLRLGTHYVLAARENFDTDSSNSESSGDALFYVDTAAVLADLFCSEAAFQVSEISTLIQ